MPEPSSTPTSPQYLPYQAYKPKRHSRNFSNSTAPNSRPSSIVVSPVASPLPRGRSDEDKDSIASFSLAGSYGTPPSTTVVKPPMSSSPAIHIEFSSDPPSGTSTALNRSPPPPEEDPSASYLSNHVQAPDVQERNTSLASSIQPVVPPPPPSVSKVKKTTTFRRISPRPLSAATTTPPTSHSRHVSTSSLPGVINGVAARETPTSPLQHQIDKNDAKRTPSPLSPPPRTSQPLPNLLADCTRPTPAVSSHADEVNPRIAPVVVQSLSQDSSNVVLTGRPSPSRVTSPVSATTKHKPAPYRPGFQPKGRYRQRTDEFLASRRLKRDGEGEQGRLARIERAKLERRLEKLIALHFPRPGPQAGANVNASPAPLNLRNKQGTDATAVRRASSFFDLERMKNIKLNDPTDLWRGIISGIDSGGKDNIRAAEQRITAWEEDSAVTKCPLCLSSFHPLTNRKHHCRICGRIVCSLPPKSPQRPVTCSLLFCVDSKTRKIEEVGEGVDYGVRRRDRPESEDNFLRAVRICRSCRPILLHQQYSQQVEEVPAFFKLYDLFITLEQEIEDSLPQFQELLLSLSHNDQPTKEASAARKRLLDAFAQYDKLSKQIRALPCPNGPGSSQDRIQASILTRANLFLQKNMFPLQSLRRPSTFRETSPPIAKHEDSVDIDPDSELAQALQPLLEQEVLLDSFIEEAKSQRKFEDARTLKINQDEIRWEIERLLDHADVGVPFNLKGNSHRP